MNKKYNGLMALLLCFTAQFSFADLASDIAKLKQQKAALESDYVPRALQALKTLFGSMAAVGFFTTYWAVSQSSALLNKSTFGLGYTDYFKYSSGWDKSLATVAQGKLTEGFIKTLPDKEQDVVNVFGMAAPGLGLFSVVFAALAVTVSEKIDRYKEKIAKLQKEISEKESELQRSP